MSNAKPTIAPLLSEDAIARRVGTLADEIASGTSRDLVVVVILKGSFVFAADLIRALERAGGEAQVDFMTLSSYGSATISSGEVALVRDTAESVARDLVLERGATSVKTCLLLDKVGKRTVPIEADFRGFEIGDKFVVGYGLDYAHHFRGLPYIGVLSR